MKKLPGKGTNQPATKKYHKSRSSVRHEPTANLEWLEPRDVMYMLNVSARTLSNWEKAGLLIPYRINKKCWYNRAEVDAMIRRHRAA